MPISFNKDTKLFRLTTKNTLYAFDVVKGSLIHRYYEKKAGAIVKTFADEPGTPVSFAPYHDEDCLCFSLDTQPLEYSYYGSGDFRATSLRIKNRDGNSVTAFEYTSHRVINGTCPIPCFPCARSEKDTKTLDITLHDKVSECELHLYYTVFYNSDVIARHACIKNLGKTDVTVEKWMSLTLDLPDNDYEVISLGGAHEKERIYMERTPAFRGRLAMESRRGASSHQMNPFMALCRKGAGENRGDVYGINLVYSGSFLNEVEGDQMGRLRVQTGLGEESFSYRLTPGETVYAPQAVMTYSPHGLGQMSRNFHRFINTCIVPEKASRQRPVVLNSWEAFYFNINEELMTDFAAAAADCGIDTVIMDDGWFGKRVNDQAGLGDWYANPDRFHNGLSAFVEKVKNTGVKFGIWIEPEMVNPDSDLYRAHPDWCIRCPRREMSYSRSQYVLDMTNPAVIEYLKASFEKVFDGVPIDYFKWDMNRHISEPGSPYLSSEDQGSVEYRYMQGVYSLYRWFEEKYPDAIIENCSGGGGRYDLAMMACSSQIWTSDNTNPRYRTYIQYTSLLAYPASVMSCHVSNPGEDFHELDLKYKVAVQGVLGYEFNVLTLPEEFRHEIRRQIKDYRTFDRVITDGELYRLSSPYESEVSAYCYVLSKDKKEYILAGAIKTDGKHISGRKKPFKKLKISTAAPDAVYKDSLSGAEYTGKELKEGIDIGSFSPDATGFDAKLWYFIKE